MHPSLIKEYEDQPHSRYCLAEIDYDICEIFKDIKERRNWVLVSRSIDQIEKVFAATKQLFQIEKGEYTLVQKKWFLCRQKIIQEKINELQKLREKILVKTN